MRVLGELEGQAFEDEVCAFLQRCFTDFQSVPARPRGHGGLDGYSHKQSVGYCCSGPEAAATQTAAKLKTAVLKKLRGDLRSLFELDATPKGGGTLAHRETPELKTILRPGRKLAVVRLIASTFDSPQLLAPLHESFAEYSAASKCHFVDKRAELTVWGPKQVAGLGAVDDLVLARLEHGEMARRIAAAIGSAPQTAPASSDLDAKLDWIESKKKASRDAVSRLRGHFRKRWSAAIAVDDDLANNTPHLHASLARAREEAARDADLASGTLELLERVEQALGERLDEHLGARLPPEVRTRLVGGELARMIGEGSVEWRPA